MANTTNFGWETPDDTDLVKDGAAAIRTLGSAIDTSLVDLKGGTTGQVLSKTSNTDMDFTWVTTDDANAIQNAIVDAKGDLIAASAADTPARLAVGADGSTLLADSAATQGLRWQGNYAAGKNLVMNSNFNIAQRGTSFAGVVTDYTIDRWQARNSGLGAFTVSQDTDAPAGFKTSAKWLCTTADASPAAADFALYRQYFEGQALQILKKGSASAVATTLSFWVKSNLTGTFIVHLNDIDNNRTISKSYTISAANTWEKKSVVIEGDTTGALDNDNAGSLAVNWFIGAGSDRTSGTLGTTWATTVAANAAVGQTNVAATLNNYWMITGVQWEIGNVATEWQLMSGTLAGELALCQRYYAKSYSTAIAPATNTTVGGLVMIPSGNVATGSYFGSTNFPVTMRSAPTVTIYSYNTSQTARVSDGGGTDLGANSGVANLVGTRSFTVENSSGGTITAASGGFVFHWVANSEL